MVSWSTFLRAVLLGSDALQKPTCDLETQRGNHVVAVLVSRFQDIPRRESLNGRAVICSQESKALKADVRNTFSGYFLKGWANEQCGFLARRTRFLGDDRLVRVRRYAAAICSIGSGAGNQFDLSAPRSQRLVDAARSKR
jgi:hypothetical protein